MKISQNYFNIWHIKNEFYYFQLTLLQKLLLVPSEPWTQLHDLSVLKCWWNDPAETERTDDIPVTVSCNLYWDSRCLLAIHPLENDLIIEAQLKISPLSDLLRQDVGLTGFSSASYVVWSHTAMTWCHDLPSLFLEQLGRCLWSVNFYHGSLLPSHAVKLIDVTHPPASFSFLIWHKQPKCSILPNLTAVKCQIQALINEVNWLSISKLVDNFTCCCSIFS
jgi:hypothetical protein